MEYSVVIVAAGSGTRMNLGYNKVYYRLGSETVLEKTISIFKKDTECKQIVVVTDPSEYRKHCGELYGKLVLVQGGKERQDSVLNGLHVVTSEYVLIQDGARPFLKQKLLDSIKENLQKFDAVCPVVACKDTIKVVQGDVVINTLDRSTLRAVQTPQAFCTELLYRCIQQAKRDHFHGTDDCSLVEKYGNVVVKVVEGDYENIKITTPEDIKTVSFF